MLTGRRSNSTDIELGMFTTLSYLLIFVTKFRGDKSSEIGIRTRRISTLEYSFWSYKSSHLLTNTFSAIIFV